MPRRALCVLGLLAALAACASRAPERTCPPDFALSLTLMDSGGGSLAPAWFVVDPDGVLRAGLGERSEQTPLPPPVRVLSDDELAEVWADAKPLLDLRSARAAPERPRSGRNVAVAYIARGGRGRTVTIDAPGEDVRPLAERLRRLAYLPQ